MAAVKQSLTTALGGHVEKRGRKLVYCASCKLPKARWTGECALAKQKGKDA